MDEIAESLQNLEQLKATGFFSKAKRRLKRAAKKAAEAAKKAAMAAINAIKKQVTSFLDIFHRYMHQIISLDMSRMLTGFLDKMFRTTEKPAFKASFFATMTPIAYAYGMNVKHVNAAYTLLIRPFWKGQFWLWKWIATGGPIKAFNEGDFGIKMYAQAGAACNQLVGTVSLGGTLMTKLTSFPNLMAAGAAIVAGSKIAKPGCIALGLMQKLINKYQDIKKKAGKFGIKIPL